MISPNGMNRLSEHQLFKDSKAGQSLHQQPLSFIDIGARGGAHDLVEPIANLTAVLGFEADEEECQRLMKNPAVFSPWANFLLQPIALFDHKGQAELKLLSANTNHSLLYPNEKLTKRYNMKKWEVIGRCLLKTDTLDSILFNSDLRDYPWGEFIKLDTQGTEYEILLGALKVLKERTVAVVTEVSFCELYQGQKLFSDIEMLMRQNGFSFYGFTSLHTRSKKLLDKKSYVTRERLIYTDAIFFKDPLAGGYAPSLNERSAYALFTIALLLGYYDYALELAKETWLLDSNQEENNRIEGLIKELAHLPIEKTSHDLFTLADSVKSNPDWTNVAVGSFIDKRRSFCDYDDILNVSPLPKTL